jgi:hypothetical protein
VAGPQLASCPAPGSTGRGRMTCGASWATSIRVFGGAVQNATVTGHLGADKRARRADRGLGDRERELPATRQYSLSTHSLESEACSGSAATGTTPTAARNQAISLADGCSRQRAKPGGRSTTSLHCVNEQATRARTSSSRSCRSRPPPGCSAPACSACSRSRAGRRPRTDRFLQRRRVLDRTRRRFRLCFSGSAKTPAAN